MISAKPEKARPENDFITKMRRFIPEMFRGPVENALYFLLFEIK